MYLMFVCTGMTRRLAEFRSLNEEDTTVLNYFDEKEIHPEHMSEQLIPEPAPSPPPIHTHTHLKLPLHNYYADIEQDESPECQDTVDKIKQIVGEPRNYGHYHLVSIQHI